MHSYGAPNGLSNVLQSRSGPAFPWFAQCPRPQCHCVSSTAYMFTLPVLGTNLGDSFHSADSLPSLLFMHQWQLPFLLLKQPCSSPRAFALFWAKARDCCPLSPAQAVLSGAWPHVLPSDAILEPSITAGFTHFSLSVVSLVLRGFVSPKGSRCSPFPLELEGKDR